MNFRFIIIVLFFITSFSIAQSKQSKIDSLNNLLIRSTDTTRINVLNQLCTEFNITGRPDTVFTIAKSIYHQAAKMNFLKGEADALNNLSYAFTLRSLYDSSNAYAEKALDICTNTNYKKGMANALNKIGTNYDRLSQNEKSLDFHSRALRISEEIADKQGISRSLNNIGIIYSNLSQYEKSSDFYLKALKIMEEIKDKKGMAASLGNIGTNFHRLSQYEKALEYYFKSLEIFEKIDNKFALASALNNIGTAYHDLSQYEKSLEYYFKSLKISEEIRNKKGMAKSLNNIGRSYCQLSQYEKSLDYCFKSLKVAEEIGVKGNVAVSLSSLGEIYFKLKQFGMAEDYLLKSKIAFTELKDGSSLKDVLKSLSDVYRETHQYRQGFEHLQQYTILKDSLFTIENTKKIGELEGKYNTEKKEKEIELLSKDKKIRETELAKQSIEIKQIMIQRNMWVGGSLVLLVLGTLLVFYIRTKRINEKISLEKQVIAWEQKALSMQMNPHFIFNSLNSISSFISQNEPTQAKKYLAKFAKLMRLILENSREAFIPLQQEIETLSYYIELEQLRFKDKFDFQINTSVDIEPAMIAIPPMLIQPQVENAILHGIIPKEGKGNIWINFFLKEGKITCEVKDDGVGRKKAIEINLGKNNLHKSLAMEITIERLDLINSKKKEKASIQVEDMEDELKNPIGTRVTFDLPLKTVDA